MAESDRWRTIEVRPPTPLDDLVAAARAMVAEYDSYVPDWHPVALDPLRKALDRMAAEWQPVPVEHGRWDPRRPDFRDLGA